jgi:integrase
MHQNPKPPRRVRVERGIYRNPTNGSYEIQYTDSSGRVRWQVVNGALQDARFTRAEIQARLGRGDLITRGDRKLADIGEEWLAVQHHLRPRTRQLYETALRRHINPRLGNKRIGDITVDRVAAFLVDLQEAGLAGSTIRNVMTPLGRILSYAARRGLISENPINRLERGERPRIGRREMRVLDRDEINALLQAAVRSYRPILATALFTGLRQGELLGLTWADIDFADEAVHVRCQLDRSGERTAPKTPQAYRQVILMPSLARLLREHKVASPYSGPEDPVFATLTGAPMHYRNVSRRGFAAAVVKSGLDQPGQPRLRFHDLRHTFASLMIAQGLNIVYVSRQLGHSTPSFTLNVYSHLFDRAEHSRRASDALEAGFGSILNT